MGEPQMELAVEAVRRQLGRGCADDGPSLDGVREPIADGT